VMHCPRCDHHWYRHQPSPERLALMYASGRRLGNGPPPSVQPSGDMRREMQRLHRLCGGLPGLRLLDSAPAAGGGPGGMATRVSNVPLSRPSASRSDSGHDRYGARARAWAADRPPFDTIQLEQVLEHVPSPFDTLTLLRSLCRPGTVLRITVPNLVARGQGRADLVPVAVGRRSRCMSLRPSSTLHGFSARSLDALLARSGYRSTTTVSAWRHYPANEVRRLIGAFCAGSIDHAVGWSLPVTSPVVRHEQRAGLRQLAILYVAFTGALFAGLPGRRCASEGDPAVGLCRGAVDATGLRACPALPLRRRFPCWRTSFWPPCPLTKYRGRWSTPWLPCSRSSSARSCMRPSCRPRPDTSDLRMFANAFLALCAIQFGFSLIKLGIHGRWTRSS
jgi:hypothetical protein